MILGILFGIIGGIIIGLVLASLLFAHCINRVTSEKSKAAKDLTDWNEATRQILLEKNEILRDLANATWQQNTAG